MLNTQNNLNPDRDMGCWLVYTIEEGGIFNIVNPWDKYKHKELLKVGYFEIKFGDFVTRIYPAFAGIIENFRGHDFRIDEINKVKEVPSSDPRERIMEYGFVAGPLEGKIFFPQTQRVETVVKID